VSATLQSHSPSLLISPHFVSRTQSVPKRILKLDLC
jgi:hypothetical protein